MPNAQTPGPNQHSTARFEIIRERDAPKRHPGRTAPSFFAALFGAVRSVVEDAYVSLAQEVMVRGEQLEDLRAERRHAKHLRSVDRRRLRAARSARPVHADATRGVPTIH